VRSIRSSLGGLALSLLLAACAAAASTPAPSGEPGAGIRGTATAGPVCPVERVPPDPDCAPRPVAGAVVLIRDATGAQVARATTGVDGTYAVRLPAGAYVVEAQSSGGLRGTPPSQPVTVAGAVVVVDLSYDTGIR
jgi:Carboxypeptidase regulatory-like domain